MPNFCEFRLRFAAPKKQTLEEIKRIMQYEDDKRTMYRVLEFVAKQPKKREKLWIMSAYGYVAWSDASWFTTVDEYKAGYEDNKMRCKEALEKYSTEDKDWHKRLEDDVKYYETHRPVGFPELCKELDFGVESWTEEPGMLFQNHTLCNRKGIIEIDEERETLFDEDGKSLPGLGFGKDFGKFFKPEIIFHGLCNLKELKDNQ